MATETLDEKNPEAEALAKDKDGVGESAKEIVSGKAVSRESDEAEEKEELKEEEKEVVKDGETEEKAEADDGESEEEETDDKKGNRIKKLSKKEPVTPVSDRPTRERKKVERYSLPTPSRSSASKAVSIEKGRGTQLREIPNVAYKLSKRKPDDNLHLLHTILYGKKAKAQMLKKNIGQFSGFVWSEKEEKQRNRVKEKLEKCVKEKLIDFCDVLDIPINKSNVKKEELSVKVLEFLEYPKATRDILLADQEKQGKKRKATPKSLASGEASDIPAKKKRQRMKAGKKRNQPSEAEGDDESEGASDSHEEGNTAPKEESDHEDTHTEEEKDETEDEKSFNKKSSSKKTVKETSGSKGKDKHASAEGTPAKSGKSSAKSGQKSSKQAAKSTSSPTKKQKAEKDQNDSSKEKGKKPSSKPQAKGSKDQGKGKASKKGKAEPTREEMHAVVVNILKEVDFNTATLSDILRKLGDHFGVDLLHRKAEVKDIITEAINNMTDDEEEEEGEENTEAGGRDKEQEDEEKN